MAKGGTLFDCTFVDIKSGAELGCQFCSWLMDEEFIPRENIIRHSPNDLPTSDPYWKVLAALQDTAMWIQEFLGDRRPHDTLRNMDLRKAPDVDSIEFFGLWNPDTGKIDGRTRHGFVSFAKSDDPASRAVSTRPIECDPGSNTTYIKISSWLRECR
ncbi:MAG: hypothetical protein M1839_004531, partial [Geoglossum umbratile]